jgi:hypothetical protein
MKRNESPKMINPEMGEAMKWGLRGGGRID